MQHIANIRLPIAYKIEKGRVTSKLCLSPTRFIENPIVFLKENLHAEMEARIASLREFMEEQQAANVCKSYVNSG